jgi:DNA-directed RNA polymerase I, II, and III subunit RPABC1
MATTNGNEISTECLVHLWNEGSIESIRYFECRRTLMEMLRDRGYNVSESDLTLTLSDFRSQFGQLPKTETLGVCVSHRSNPSNKVLWFVGCILFTIVIVYFFFCSFHFLESQN